MKCGVLVRTSYGLLQSRQNIIMLIACTVIAHIAALSKKLHIIKVHGELFTVIICRKYAKLHCIYWLSYITATAPCDMLQHTIFKTQFQSQLISHKLKSTLYCRQDLLRSQRLELKHSWTANYSIVHIKIRIFSGRSDKSYLAVFNVFKKRLLLFFVKILYLVKIKQDTINTAECLSFCNYLLDISNRSTCAVKLMHSHISIICYHSCDRSFANTWRTIKNHIRYFTAFDNTPERFIFA